LDPNDPRLRDLRRTLFLDEISLSSSNILESSSSYRIYETHEYPRASSNIDSNVKGIKLITEEGGDNLQNFLLAAARRNPMDTAHDLVQDQLDKMHKRNKRTRPPVKGEVELPDPSHIREWTYRDILRFPGKQKEEWRHACIDELSTLKERQVFELVDLPKGKKAIRNRWVFDIKPDGRKCARLVAKGFSQ
jgi:hypothetical protein